MSQISFFFLLTIFSGRAHVPSIGLYPTGAVTLVDMFFLIIRSGDSWCSEKVEDCKIL